MACAVHVAWDERLTDYHFGPGHPLAPVRLALTMRLTHEFGLWNQPACATGHDTPACRAAPAAVIPRSATSAPAWSRSRAVSRHRGGTCGSHSVNVLRRQPGSPHFQRRLTQHTATRSPPRRTSLGRADTVSWQRAETVPQSGHAAAAG